MRLRGDARRFPRWRLFAAIWISKRDAIDIAGEGLKAGFVGMRFAGERHGQQGAAMKGIFKTNYGGAFGVGARDFDGIFDRFRASVTMMVFLGLCRALARLIFPRGRCSFRTESPRSRDANASQAVRATPISRAASGGRR